MKGKFVKISFVIAIAVIGGLNVFNAQKPIVLSDIAMANVEALAQTETSNNTIKGDCYEYFSTTKECHIVCPKCGTVWVPKERQPYSIAWDVSGKCGKCGNTSWKDYNHN